MMLAAAIFDVDGVLLASPHERAWREALAGIADPALFTTDFYQANVAGKPRMDGALAALTELRIADPEKHIDAYANDKQERLEALIAAGEFSAYPDALRFVRSLMARGMRMAVASSSKNANDMLRLIKVTDDHFLIDAFAANVCGRDLEHGKPDPEIFLLAAKEMGISPERCFVAEDAPVGVEAARRGGMAALGVARFHDAAKLRAAGADLAVTSLDQVALADLLEGRLVASTRERASDGG
jgi:beta-phosphoglucomutase